MNAKHLPWRDHGGRFSSLKAVVLVALFIPGAWVLAAYSLGLFAPRPLNEAIHQIGLWALRLLFVTLAVTPLRQTLDWPRLVLVRRMIGVASFGYAALHLLLYTADQAFDLVKVASEIALRIYLTIGFIGLVGLMALAATSTDGMIRRLGGRRWRRLHRLAYAVAALAVIHHFMQSKANVGEPFVMAGLFLWLMGYRILAARRRPSLLALTLLGGGAALLTALCEAFYYFMKVGAPWDRLLAANLSVATGMRPSWVVGAIAAAVVAAVLMRALARPLPRLRARTT
jgi:methionine sulfoxide reductase heme-binding subunit